LYCEKSQEIAALTEQVHAFIDQLAKLIELVGVAIIFGRGRPRRSCHTDCRGETI
jgi:hypothetical protein